jgi:purine catabolism regulator
LYEPYNFVVALTVGDLLRVPGLDLRLLAGRRALEAAIRWVHVSELEDPTPWLKGGELLLTTGIGVGTTPARQRAYVARLAGAGLSGLGFGVGFSYRKVPKALLEAADRASFPVFEVPYAMPFIAITEAVFTRLVAEQYDLLSRSLEAEHTLTRAVLEGEGVRGIVASLSRATRGWAILLDLHGAALAAMPPKATAHAPRVWAELQSPRADGHRFGMSLVEGAHHIAIHPVAAQGRVEAFLGIGKREALTQFDRIVSSHAVSLLALELAKARAVSEAESRLKGDLLDQLVTGAVNGRDARRALERFGFDLEKPLAVVALSGAEPPEALARRCDEVLARGGRPFLASPREDHVLAVFQPKGPGFLPPLRSAVADRASGPVIGGAGSLVPFDRLRDAVREAGYALQVCRTEDRAEAEFSDLGTYQLLLSLQDPEALQTFAASVLGPLDRYDQAHGGELVPSLRAFLERNARWESAAADLFVHRHTLRYRMRKVEELTQRNLRSARDRMEFFLALRARDLLDSGDEARLS